VASFHIIQYYKKRPVHVFSLPSPVQCSVPVKVKLSLSGA
jgi:hypothetical protein